MGKTRKYIPEIRVRKPYRREPKMRTNVPIEMPFDAYDYMEFEDTEVDEVPCEEDTD